MKKKSRKKIVTKSKQNKVLAKARFIFIRNLGISLSIILLLILGKTAFSTPHVLGLHTGPVLLVDNGDSQDNVDSKNTTQENQPQTNTSNNQPINPQNQDNSSQPTQEPQQSQPQAQDNTQVDCVGPDGKHFTTDFHNCQELNQKWGNQKFSFTPLSTPQNTEQQQPEQQQVEPTQTPEAHQTIETPQGKLEVQTEGNKGQLNLETPNMHIEIKREDNGAVSITAKKSDGTEIQLQSDALDQINQALQEKDVEVGTSSANGFIIKNKQVQAETNFPLSIDPTTKQLAVTTPDGTKDVAVLPNEAVQSLLQKNLLTAVLSQATQTTASAGAAQQVVLLTSLNNQPAFAVNGVLNKKILGILPVSFAKTIFVSSTTGNVLQTQETLLNQLLQAISF